MKKLVSLLLAVGMSFSSGIMLTSCDEGLEKFEELIENTFAPKDEEHTHDYDTEWTKDQTHHWHVCKLDGCTSISDKGEHTFDETGTCTVCLAESQEGGSQEEGTQQGGSQEETWDSILETENFDNVTFRLYGQFSDGELFDEEIKLDGDSCVIEDSVETDAELVASVKSIYINTVLGVLENFGSFTYDSDNNVYRGNADIVYNVNVTGTDVVITAKNVVVTIDANQKLATMSCDMTQAFEGEELNLTVTFEFSDYGTTVVG